jgi:predicted dienelactone hydrolase
MLFFPPFADIKRGRINTADRKTTQLIEAGFAYGGHTFSASLAAQVKWAGAYVAREALTYPLQLPDIDNALVELPDAAAVAGAYGALVQHVQAVLASGAVLKQRLKEATSEGELNAIVDDR